MKNNSILLIILVLLSNTTTKSQDYELQENNPNLSTSKQEQLLGQVDNFFVDSIKVYSVVNGNSKMTYQYDESGRRVFDQKEIWNNNQWIGKERYSCKYEQDKKVFEMTEVWADGQWIGKERNTCTFNTNKSITNALKEIWNKGEWVGKERQSWTYNDFGKPTYSLRENFSNNEWNNFKRTFWTYDSENRLIKISTEIYPSWEEWCYLEGETWTYDKSGNEIEYKKDIKYDGFYLRNLIRNKHKFDSNGQIIYQSNESWKWYDPADVGAHDYYQIIDSFDSKGNKLYYFEKIFSSSGENYEKTESWTYDDSNRISSYTYNNAQRYIYDYDDFSRKISEIYGNLINNTFIPANKWNWSYNSEGDTTIKQYGTWNNNEFIPDFKITTDYKNSKPVCVLKEIWKSNAWLSEEKLIFSYNEQDSIIKKTLEKWKDNIWVMKRIYNWEYDTAGNNTLYTIKEIVPEFEEFTIIYKETKSYAINSIGTFLTRFYKEIWGDEIPELFPQVEIKWVYNANGNLLKKEYQEYTQPDMVYFKEGGWYSGNIFNYSYDNNGNITKHKYQIWTSGYGYDKKWRTEFSYNYQYDEFGNLLLISSDDGDTNWVEKKLGFKDKVGFEYGYDCYKIEVFYTKVTGVEEEQKIISGDFFIYPNPVKDFCNIDYKSNSNQNLDIKIIHIEGKILFSTAQNVSVGDNLLQLNTSEIPTGVYFVLITSNNEQRKGILIK